VLFHNLGLAVCIYRGKRIDGIFELFHGITDLQHLIISQEGVRYVDDEFGGLMILVILTMDVAKMYYTEVEAMVDLIVIIPLTILAVFVGAINSNYKICSVIIGNLEVDVNKFTV